MTKTQQAQPEPRPWHVNWHRDENIVRTIETERALEVAIVTTGDFGDAVELANAEFIVEACNAHDALTARVAELEDAMQEISQQCRDAIELGGSGIGFFEDLRDVARAVLKGQS